MITSAWPKEHNEIGNLLIFNDDVILAQHPLIKNPVNGLGDMTAALFLGYLMADEKPQQALRLTSTKVYELLYQTRQTDSYELKLENSLHFQKTVFSDITLHEYKRNDYYAKK
ncbi:hypothetical protein [Bartonella tamiae]|uniref:Pyridoxal kinase n=1 Tax=Bartonella tamiae Th239 TaxID=1094558 RepID=J1K253_9HYPH|nr:hypothetical protein [Bartonella tamiae]EJF91537.1 hypothetical protein ME5_00232 [Bartonella tamiae Th239]EJF92479.1 hypothetical protein MEG_01649 [Bartonella tamiae Th307]